MASYQVPPDTSAKEKIIGGFLSVNQLIWVLVGLALGVGLGSFLKLLIGQIGLIIGIIPGLVGAFIFCFVKIHQLTVWQFITYTQKQKKRTKQLPNIRLEGMTGEEKDDLYKINYQVSNRVLKIKEQPKKSKKKGLFLIEHIQ